MNEVHYDTPTPHWKPLFSNWGLHCSLKQASPSHFAHNDVTNNNNNNHQKPHGSWLFSETQEKQACTCIVVTEHYKHYKLLTQSQRSEGLTRAQWVLRIWLALWLTTWRCFPGQGRTWMQCVWGRGFFPLPMWTQHHHTHSALSSVSSSSPSSSSSSLQLYKTEKETYKKTVKWLFLVSALSWHII